MSQILEGKHINSSYFRPKYPDFRFQCPYCGDLEVLISIHSTDNSFNAKCLECGRIWNE